MMRATITHTTFLEGDVKLVRFEACTELSVRLRDIGAGAHVDVALENGLIRQYSVFDLDADGNFSIGVKLERQSRGGSASIHASFAEGQEICIADVRNHFRLVPGPRPVLIAAGIGITPILSMLQKLRQINADYRLLYVCRAGEAAFKGVLAADQKAVVLDGPTRDQTRQAILNLSENLGGSTVYTCGPTEFMVAVEEIVTRMHGPGRVKSEAFSKKAPEGNRTAFSVKLASTGAEYRIEAEQTILEVLRTKGLSLPSSCEEGVCGSCLVGLLEGQAIHYDTVLTEEEKAEQRDICLCVSRSAGSTLTLDL